MQAKNLYFLLNGRLRTTEEQSGSGSFNGSVDYGRGKSVGFVEAYQVGTLLLSLFIEWLFLALDGCTDKGLAQLCRFNDFTRNRDTAVKTFLR